MWKIILSFYSKIYVFRISFCESKQETFVTQKTEETNLNGTYMEAPSLYYE